MRFFIGLILASILFFHASTWASSSILKHKMSAAHVGDYIVVRQEKTYSLLNVLFVDTNRIVLEEISTTENKGTWKEWMQKGSPGATAWLIYEIDTENDRLIECFAPAERRWVFLDSSTQFFPRLLSLSFNKIADTKRRKIGPAPANGENDHRKTWNPKIAQEGQLITNPVTTAYGAQWPDDTTRLAGCKIELYFDEGRKEFPFPVWLEVFNGHYTMKMQVVDSGSNMNSNFHGSIPHRPPVFLAPPKTQNNRLTLSVDLPRKDDTLSVCALPIDAPSLMPIHLPFTLSLPSDKKEAEIIFEQGTLDSLLKKNLKYRFIITVNEYPDVYAESPFVFTP